MGNNQDDKTVSDFGKEWNKFDQTPLSSEEYDRMFNNYFDIFPFDKISLKSVGADIGCGSGRWARSIAPRVSKLYCIDASSEALAIAKKNLFDFKNIEFLNQSIGELGLKDSSLDFLYCLGVLHHIPDTSEGIKSCVNKIKPGGYFLVYLYYNLDNRPFFFRQIWKVSNIIRKIIAKLPNPIKFFICDMIAALVYFPLTKTAKLLEKLGLNFKHLPLSFYRNSSYYILRNDALDRFGTRLEKRFSRKQIEEMLENAGLEEIIFSDREPYWVALGKRKKN